MRKVFALFVFVLALTFATSAPAVVINEIMYTTEGGNCFIELYNRSGVGADMNIRNWEIQWTGDNEVYQNSVVLPDEDIWLAPGEFYLVTSADAFVAVPDLEADVWLETPDDPSSLRGVRLVESDGSTVHDTVLYGLTGVTSTTLTDDASAPGTYGSGRYIISDALAEGGSGTALDLNGTVGNSARRKASSGHTDFSQAAVPAATAAEGNGLDTNNSAVDFVGAAIGSASPEGNTTPVRISRFELE